MLRRFWRLTSLVPTRSGRVFHAPVQFKQCSAVRSRTFVSDTSSGETTQSISMDPSSDSIQIGNVPTSDSDAADTVSHEQQPDSGDENQHPVLGPGAIDLGAADRARVATTGATSDGVVPTDKLEIKDPQLIFEVAWNNLVKKYGGEVNLSFPKDIMWLAGAPGSGKGLMTPFILENRGIVAPPLEVGALLTSEEAMQMKSHGKLVGDRMVVELLLDALLRKEYVHGVVVDGFPRTAIQAECIKLLYDKMRYLRSKYDATEHAEKFRRPIFHITVLFIEKEESIRRQLKRGQEAIHHNEIVRQTGVGKLVPVRETDLDVDLANERYRQFKDQVYGSLQAIKQKFHFHFINAEGSVKEVERRIVKELAYQSSMELGDQTFEKVRNLPLASEIIQNARHELVRRLDMYQSNYPVLFERVIQTVQDEFIEIIRRQALAGRAIIRSDNPIFNESYALDMTLDLLSERGFTIVLDFKRQQLPDRIDMNSGKIMLRESRIYEFQIEFPRPTIRRG